MYILVVEDDPNVADFIKKGMEAQNHNVDIAYDGMFGEKLGLENQYDLIILDVLLPYINGLEVCKRIRKFKADIPILMLSALGTLEDKVSGFNSGADDYMVKPFHFKELLMRVKALGRRKKMAFPGMLYTAGDLEMDSYRKIVRRSGKAIYLTAKEFSLLEFLIVNKNSVMSRADIAESVWGITSYKDINVIDVYINYLRNKIDMDFDKKLIQTVIGVGYVLRET